MLAVRMIPNLQSQLVCLMSWLYCQFASISKLHIMNLDCGARPRSPEMITINELSASSEALCDVRCQGTPWWNIRGVENRSRHLRALPSNRIRRNQCDKDLTNDSMTRGSDRDEGSVPDQSILDDYE